MFFENVRVFGSAGASHYRIPSLCVTPRGTALAFANDRRGSASDHVPESALVLARREAGGAWSAPRVLVFQPGYAATIGSAMCLPQSGEVICFFHRYALTRPEFARYTPEDDRRFAEEQAAKAKADGVEIGWRVLRSRDDGISWEETPLVCTPISYKDARDGQTRTAIPSAHGSTPGIVLRYGAHAGRIVCPARYAVGSYASMEEIRDYVANCALLSDDGGKTWFAGGSAQRGTGEGTLIERANGEILFNSRAYFFDQKRYLDLSRDGGETFESLGTDPTLLEERRIGCCASLLRIERAELADDALLPPEATSVTLFSNPRAEDRSHMTICISWDEARTWALSREIWPGAASYSTLAYSAAESRLLLLYERGMGRDPCGDGLAVAGMDFEWLLRGAQPL